MSPISILVNGTIPSQNWFQERLKNEYETHQTVFDRMDGCDGKL